MLALVLAILPARALAPWTGDVARIVAVPIVPITVEYEKSWRLKSWDRFFIPKPFSVVRVRFLPFVHVPEEESPEDARQRLSALLKPEQS